jgi:hypothetical protein
LAAAGPAGNRWGDSEALLLRVVDEEEAALPKPKAVAAEDIAV